MNCSASVYYSNSYFAQTASVGSSGTHINIPAPSAVGVFRVNLAGTLYITSGTPSAVIHFFVNSEEVVGLHLDVLQAPGPNPPIVFQVKPTDTISFYVNYSTLSATGSFDAFITLEQLQ